MRHTIFAIAALLCLSAPIHAQEATPAAAAAPAEAAPAPGVATPVGEATKMPDGSTVQAMSDGSTVTTLPDGSTITKVPSMSTTTGAPVAKTNPPMTGPQLLIATSMGDITLQLDAVRAPKTVKTILRYVREKHYDGTVFYRVQKGFVDQMGSWEANLKGRGIVKPDVVPLEANNGLSNIRGTIALARADAPDSGGAEFFINVGDNSFALDQNPNDKENTTGFAVFGQVISDMDVADAINVVPVGDNGPMPGQAPIDPILIKKVSIIGEVEKPVRRAVAAKPAAAKPAKK